ncbi:MAG: tRNA uridine(34) 5-carboxymethylaminomethyl modification radical SAM/GNAT enzyme Elp3 [Anaerolineales bacterium]|nr:tRNA uridine(34) 5-carboxymethylaminomethyl modification radical SAM/GNAT enzyme Elp3 [Anaerolineales bacterium]
MDRERVWLEARDYTPEQLKLARKILEDVRSGMDVLKATRRHPQSGGGYIGKHVLVHLYRSLTESGEWPFEQEILQRIRMKPIRTLSGVTTVSVLTKPFPCPGTCIFCPDITQMPKSYLPDEPGAMRALHHAFDPYDQTSARITALESIGHPTDKIELLILGGTWSAYEDDYQEWFIQRCLDAMNDFESISLQEAQSANEDSLHRNVGLTIETRPDWVTPTEVRRLRKLGVTKVQLGVQSLDDSILELNNRGHGVEETRRATALIRSAGFKVVMHWMPNLLGATLESDREDFMRLWNDESIRPDEIKIYPCQLLDGTELLEYWEKGEYKPYTTDELVHLIAEIKPSIPRYCRVNRIVRDIPSANVIEGNKRTSLRQDIHREMAERDLRCECIRCREIRSEKVDIENLEYVEEIYATSTTEEHFLSFVNSEDRLAGYLRLALPHNDRGELDLPDLAGAAIVREVHVYGQSLPLGSAQSGAAQHVGIGVQLMERAEEIAIGKGYQRMAVIAALGTRGYYRKLGYQLGNTYMVKELISQ